MELKTTNLLNLEKTISKDLFENENKPWDILPKISQFIIDLGKQLDLDKFDKIGDNVWIAKSAKVSQTAGLNGPLIVDEDAEIRHCAYIRGSVIVGKGTGVGNSTEVKNSILFDGVQVPHYNYVGDSILGHKVHMGAGSITSNIKSDKGLIKISCDNGKIDTGLRKFGAILGDCVEVGCNAVLNPGTIIGKNSAIYPLCSVRGILPENCIYKSNSVCVKRYC